MSTHEQPIGTYDSSFNKAAYSLVRAEETCLDVGCWSGNMGRELVRNKQCTVDGIDFHVSALAEAKRNGYRNLFRLDLNNPATKLEGIEQRYDTILCCDVLEHLLLPKERLEELTVLLKPGGRIIVSLPNIGFVLYRLKHLFGIWNYEDTGIMDRTHVVFFTKSSAERMFHAAACDVDMFKPYNEVSARYFFLRLLGKLYPSLFAVQLVYTLRPDHLRKAPNPIETE